MQRDQSILEKACKYEKIRESSRKSHKKYRETSPHYKKLASIRTMKYQANKKGDVARVQELEDLYEKTKKEFGL